ncbi:hypothetical protein [Comamonas sp.]|uniref:hypothetical protein n=1 Tax=Comamonas sp. TaxID=34028 RepID=UPI003A9359F1
MGRNDMQFDLFDSMTVLEELRTDLEEAEIDPPVVHSMVRAEDCSAPLLAGPTSVFDLAATGLQLRAPPTTPEKNSNVMLVTRGNGVVRCQVVRFSETDEGMEKERQRRARQIVPRARKQTFKMRNSRIWDDPQS